MVSAFHWVIQVIHLVLGLLVIGMVIWAQRVAEEHHQLNCSITSIHELLHCWHGMSLWVSQTVVRNLTV